MKRKNGKYITHRKTRTNMKKRESMKIMTITAVRRTVEEMPSKNVR